MQKNYCLKSLNFLNKTQPKWRLCSLILLQRKIVDSSWKNLVDWEQIDQTIKPTATNIIRNGKIMHLFGLFLSVFLLFIHLKSKNFDIYNLWSTFFALLSDSSSRTSDQKLFSVALMKKHVSRSLIFQVFFGLFIAESKQSSSRLNFWIFRANLCLKTHIFPCKRGECEWLNPTVWLEAWKFLFPDLKP